MRWLAAGLLLLLTLPQAWAQSAGVRLARAAQAQIGVTTGYDPAYVRLAYPGGDVPPHTGVCSDVVVRAFRAIGVDLQRALHEDMRADFAAYPRKWGLSRPDRNIDHRRVPNLMRFFTRRGTALETGGAAADYRPGDVVAWRLDNGLPHIGIVGERAPGEDFVPVIHNIGAGARREDVLFAWTMIGHYRWKDS
jgi:uncharacterized protein YijF (DUF1287 family)